MIDLSKSTNHFDCHMHVIHVMPDGEHVLHCRTNATDVRVSARALMDFERLGGKRVVLENAPGETWVMAAAEIKEEPDYVESGKHGPFWGVPWRASGPQPRGLKQTFGSTNPQLRTIQDRLGEGDELTITKFDARLNGQEIS